MLIRRETDADVATVRHVTALAFASAAHSAPPVEPGGPPGEVTMLDALRRDPAWIPALSLVAVGADGDVVGHAVSSRATVGGLPALGLGPVSVRPDVQRSGIGSALMHTMLGAAEALEESVVVLLGDPAYYRRFGFEPAADIGIISPVESWGPYFQARTLWAYDASVTGRFAYAEPFNLV